MVKKGNPFGTHRVLEPVGALPQPALRVSNNMDDVYDNEIRVNVEVLNVDSASFTQIKKQANGDEAGIRKIILDIVKDKGKLKNPVTGSGGMFIGTVDRVGEALVGKVDIKAGDKIASLVSLSQTPLRIDEIIEVKKNVDQVRIKGQAILFETGIYAKLPKDMPESLALAILDVAGAAAQTDKLVKPGQTVVIVGASGKSGILCAYQARKKMGKTGKIIGLVHSDKGKQRLSELGFCDDVVTIDASNALACYEAVHKITNGKLADVIINNVSTPDTEMGSILMCKENGLVYFFSMATSFTKAALGAEGVGKDVTMLIGNGYVKGHAEFSLNILRESKVLREMYEKLYA